MTSRFWKYLFWCLWTVCGVFALAVLALSRGETVSALWIVIAAVCVFTVSYRFHSAWLMAKVLTLDDARVTPAVTHEDGKDFVPTNKWVVFGHHFAAIAGPGPLVGPVLAAQFGYLPGLLWMLIGATLGGAVHDSIILFCSVRRSGKSLGQMVREEVGHLAGVVSLVSIVAIMVILLAVLALVVVKALAESPWGLSTILATIPIAVIMGLGMRSGRVSIGWISFFGVAALLFSVWGGQWIAGSRLEPWLTLSGPSLAFGIMGYALLASILPVWVLLAPRDYLSTYLKIGAVVLLGAAIAILAPRLQMPALTQFIDGSGPVFAGPIFPFCFITIACGAISGFHALVSSGTTPKLIRNERDIRVVGYGGMMMEMIVGVTALIAACVMQPGMYFAINMKGAPEVVVATVTALGYPITLEEMSALAASVGEMTMFGRTGGAPTFAVGMALMLAEVFRSPGAMALWYHFAIMFEAMFILTTIDAGTRVGRFLVQDLLGCVVKPLGRVDSFWSSLIASLLFVGAWGWFLYQGVVDPLGGINSLWPIFGVANQLLAVIALSLGVTVLLKMGRARYTWVPGLPLVWLLCVTFTAGWMKIFSPDPRLGFLSTAESLRQKIAAGGAAAQLSEWKSLLLSNQINAIVTGGFLILVLLVVASCGCSWWQLWRDRTSPN